MRESALNTLTSNSRQGSNPGSLIIKVVKGRLTHDTEFIGKMDPYIKMTLGT